MQIYQYAVMLNPTVEKEEAGELPEIIVEPAYLVARDQKMAEIMVARKIPEKYIKVLDRCIVACRPF